MEWAGALAPMLLASWRTRCPCSRSRRPRAVAVARHLLRPLPPLRSPCLHVAVAPLRSRRHCAFAGDHRAYALGAVLCCLVRHVGRPWLRSLVGRVAGVVVAVLGVGRVRTRLVPYSSAFSAALGFTPLSASSLASLLAPVSESLSRGGGTSSSLDRPSSMRCDSRASGECGMGSISHFSSRWPKQCQYSDSSPPRAHMASSYP